jgi:predicted nucleotidyltransferase
MRYHEALFPKTRAEILALFFLNPRERFYLREVVRRLGSGHSTVQIEIAQLWRAHLLVKAKEGNRLYYQANVESFVYHELRALLDRTVGPVGQIREALGPLRSQITAAFIYGSVASDTATGVSDVDVMIVGVLSFGKAVRALRPTQERIGREVNPSVFPPREFRSKLKTGSPFLENVMAGPKKFVIGDRSELENLV